MGNHDKASQASLSCFRQNLNAYNFSSNENMTLKLPIMTHFDMILLFNSFFIADSWKFSKLQGGRFMNMVY